MGMKNLKTIIEQNHIIPLIEKLNRTKSSLMLEKLKISSKSKIDANDNADLLKEILYVLNINDKNPLQYPKDRLDFFKEEIQDWISKNHVKNVKYLTSKYELDIYKDYYIKDHKDILNYFDTNDNLRKETCKNFFREEFNKIHILYSNDYCEIVYTSSLLIIKIQEPTHQINLTFYVVKTNEE